MQGQFGENFSNILFDRFLEYTRMSFTVKPPKYNKMLLKQINKRNYFSNS